MLLAVTKASSLGGEELEVRQNAFLRAKNPITGQGRPVHT